MNDLLYKSLIFVALFDEQQTAKKNETNHNKQQRK
jgi:hypothetical protein